MRGDAAEGGATPRVAESRTEGLSTVSRMFHTLENKTITFGAALPTPTITDITGTGAYRRVRAELTLPAEYNSIATLGLADGSGHHSISVLATAAWLGGLSVSLEVPDLSAAAGWDDTWRRRAPRPPTGASLPVASPVTTA